jgi:hypothetical protein
MKLFHRPAHTISTELHREAYPRAARWKLVILGAVIGGLLTGGGTLAIARVHTQLAHVHAKHRHDEWRKAQLQSAALHAIYAAPPYGGAATPGKAGLAIASHRHWCTRP